MRVHAAVDEAEALSRDPHAQSVLAEVVGVTGDVARALRREAERLEQAASAAEELGVRGGDHAVELVMLAERIAMVARMEAERTRASAKRVEASAFKPALERLVGLDTAVHAGAAV
jgi:hypothetical protein